MEHIQLNLAFSHLLRGQSAASKWLHFSFAFQPPPPQYRCQFDDLFVFLRSTDYLTGIHIHGREMKGWPWLITLLVFLRFSFPFFCIYLSSSGFKNSNSLWLRLHQFLYHSVIKLVINQMIKSLLNVYHVPGTMLGTSEHQWMGQKSPSS